MKASAASFVLILACCASLVMRTEAQPADAVRALPIPLITFQDARSIGVDPLGAVYVADAGRDAVLKFDVFGRLLATIGGPGSREGEFDGPSAVDPTNGLTLYVADAGNHRIQLFSKAYAYLGSIPLSRSPDDGAARVTYRRQDDESTGFATGVPVAMTTSDANELYAIDADRSVVLKWNENRRLTDVIGDVDGGAGALTEPVDLWAASLLYVVDRGSASVAVYDQFGSYVRWLGSGRLVNPRAVTVVDSRVFVLTDAGLVLYDAAGRFEGVLKIESPEVLVDVTAAPDGSLYALGKTRAYMLAFSD